MKGFPSMKSFASLLTVVALVVTSILGFAAIGLADDTADQSAQVTSAESEVASMEATGYIVLTFFVDDFGLESFEAGAVATALTPGATYTLWVGDSLVTTGVADEMGTLVLSNEVLRGFTALLGLQMGIADAQGSWVLLGTVDFATEFANGSLFVALSGQPMAQIAIETAVAESVVIEPSAEVAVAPEMTEAELAAYEAAVAMSLELVAMGICDPAGGECLPEAQGMLAEAVTAAVADLAAEQTWVTFCELDGSCNIVPLSDLERWGFAVSTLEPEGEIAGLAGAESFLIELCDQIWGFCTLVPGRIEGAAAVIAAIQAPAEQVVSIPETEVVSGETAVIAEEEVTPPMDVFPY